MPWHSEDTYFIYPFFLFSCSLKLSDSTCSLRFSSEATSSRVIILASSFRTCSWIGYVVLLQLFIYFVNNHNFQQEHTANISYSWEREQCQQHAWIDSNLCIIIKYKLLGIYYRHSRDLNLTESDLCFVCFFFES